MVWVKMMTRRMGELCGHGDNDKHMVKVMEQSWSC